jgi:chromatin remodeling complex protein RSC6
MLRKLLKENTLVRVSRYLSAYSSFFICFPISLKMVRATKSVVASTTPSVSTENVVSIEIKKARVTKSVSKKAETPVVETTVAPVATEAKKEKKTRVSKAAKTEVTEKVEVAKTEAPITDAPTTDAAVTDATSENALQNMIREQGQNIQTQINALVALKNNHKLIEKQVAREIKNSQKAQLKKKKRTSKSSVNPSSFQKATDISNEIAKFIGVEVGTKMSRTDVNGKIHEYVITNNLRDAKDRRIIYPDEKLSALLRIPADTKLGYFNIQSYLSGHFATRHRAPLYA